ncbi:MAG: hypothetical protein V4594_12495 [Bacteroidota bacterium]
MAESEYVALSVNDVVRIEMDLYPKAKRTLLWMSAAFIGLSFLLPFVPGRRSKPLVDSVSYPLAFLFFFLVFACFVFYVYRISVSGLAADLRDGQKCVFKTRVSRKVWKGTEQFELQLEELPKTLSRKKFVYPSVESHCFQEGDVVVLEYLERSAVLLKVYAEV